MRKRVLVLVIIVIIAAGALLWLCCHGPRPGHVKDEAALVGRTAESLPAADEDYFHDMDYGMSMRPAEVQAVLDPYMRGISPQEAQLRFVRGRNNWVVWSGGNDVLWDKLNPTSFGTLDLLKTISSHPKMKYGRYNRWSHLGLVNEPCFHQATHGRTDRYGLWLDERKAGCPPDPFENEAKYPGVQIGARGKTIPAGSFYGYATGVMGLRLFPNPAFDEKAQKHWNAERYYTDPSYYNDRTLVKPYRVGMACAFCHIGPNPSNPPRNPEEPEYANLSSNPGAQYFWVDRIFVWDPKPNNFAYQLFHCSLPGTLDTSFVSSDQINNPRTMNAIYNLPARMAIAAQWHHEQLAGDELNNKQFNDYVKPDSALIPFFDPKTGHAMTPRVLKDGSDSVGALGALNRVYLNIGLFSEEWTLHFIPLLGGPKITPIRIADAEKNSSFWKATEMQTPDVALFFLASTQPDKLANAPGHEKYMTADAAQLTRGKEVFAERCARCHSSKLPAKAFTDFFHADCAGPKYLQCWNDYWKWTKTAEFKTQMKEIALRPDFLDGNPGDHPSKRNALTTDLRVPVTLLETNCCSPLATNAIRGNIWDNFASDTYKNLPSVGSVQIQNPYTGAVSNYELPGGGRGWTRPPSLVSVWATAPFFLSNSLGGPMEPSGSVDGRMASFNASITQLLWPERRLGNEYVITRSGLAHPGIIDRLPEKAYLLSGPGYLPGFAQGLPKVLGRALPNVFSDGNIKLGPFPKGTPVSLVSNVDLSKLGGVLGFAVSFQRYLEAVSPNDSDDVTARKFAPLVPKLLKLSKCRDYVINKGHYFGTAYLPASEGEPGLSDADKLALIEFLKTF